METRSAKSNSMNGIIIVLAPYKNQCSRECCVQNVIAHKIKWFFAFHWQARLLCLYLCAHCTNFTALARQIKEAHQRFDLNLYFQKWGWTDVYIVCFSSSAPVWYIYSFVSRSWFVSRDPSHAAILLLGRARFLNKIARISRHEIPEPLCMKSKIKVSQTADMDAWEQRKPPILWRFWGFSVWVGVRSVACWLGAS